MLAAAGSDLIASDARLNIYPSLVHTVARATAPAAASPELIRLYHTAIVLVSKGLLWAWSGELDGDVNVFTVNSKDAYPAKDGTTGLTEKAAKDFIQSITKQVLLKIIENPNYHFMTRPLEILNPF